MSSRTRPSPVVWIGIGALALTWALSTYVVAKWKRPGSMSLVESLSSDMTRMPPPPGRGAVELAAVERGTVRATVRYTGSAVGYVEQEIYPRVQGWITWMPLYAGDRVRKGQLLAKLDTRELGSRVDERRAGREMREQETGIAHLEYAQSQAAAAQARGEVASKQGALEEVRGMRARAVGMLKESQSGLTEANNELKAMQSEFAAARQERAEAEAMLQAAQAEEPEAEAMVAAMEADDTFWQQQIARSRGLLDRSVIAREEFQRDESMAKAATAKVRQAQAKLQGVRSSIRAARARVARSEAMVESALAKIAQLQARVQGTEAKIEQAQAEIGALDGRIRMAQGDLEAAEANARAMQAMAGAGAKKIAQAHAGLREAQAALATASVVRGYTEIRALVDGVVTQRLISPGVLVNPGQALLKVAQLSPIRLQANVAGADLARIRVGAAVTVRPRDGAGQPVTARVTSITPAIDPVARTGVVEALYPNADARFLPGQYLVMEIATRESQQALRVLSSALRWESAASSAVLSTNEAAYVWLATATSSEALPRFTVRRVRVRTGASDGSYTEVLSGLTVGQQVVARGHEDLEDGDTVAAAAWTPEGPAVLPPADLPADPGGPGAHQGHGAAPVGEKAPAPAPPSPSGHEGHGRPAASPAPPARPPAQTHEGHGGGHEGHGGGHEGDAGGVHP